MGSELSIEGQGNDYLGLIGDEVAKIKAILVDRISRVESCVKEGGVSAARGSQQVQEIQEMEERFEAERADLQAQLREKEEILHARGSDFKRLEENLSAKIHDLESQVREKERLLDLRDAELKDLKSKMRTLYFSPASPITPTEEDTVTPKEAEEEQGETARRSEVEQRGIPVS